MIPFLTMLVFSVLFDSAARPRAGALRDWRGVALHGLVMTSVFGLILAATGNAVIAALVGAALAGLFMVASNAKRQMLGEPLVFSDLALLGGVVRHPRFYFSALSPTQRWMLAIGAGAAVIAMVLLSSLAVQPHLAGAALVLGSGLALAGVLRSRALDRLAQIPDLEGDFRRLGMVATLLLYWWRWRESPDPQPCEGERRRDGAAMPELVVIVQCESFCDPLDITHDPRDSLPGLDAARAAAWQWGTLDVSGFGAYTMRTEYGVLFGRSEEALGFRRYDPFLTASGEASYALSARLRGAGYRSVFVHPHDLRFYSRDRLMPQVGFAAMIGEEGIAARDEGAGRYVDDRTLGSSVIAMLEAATGPTMIYTVTMENHGPWDSDTARDAAGRRDAYLRHARSSDAMLRDLTAYLAQAGRSGLLAFFGDHRPSIPGVTAPGGARHTPYVMLRFREDGSFVSGGGDPVDLTPAELHHRILHCVATPQAVSPRAG
ncbi:LTA synthase family protein [Sphingomonas echinoides]|uniref:LTA synthase family protein n=1 Tax=Sphingomonas echinoides TaxID=59803 RepID=UPI00241375C8|nr:LTA synthase family protein [Sphingomonas echinoides]